MRYGTTDVLHGIDFDIRTGEVVALLGPNGTGKTTTIEILEGFRARSARQVTVLGADPEHAGEQWRARLGVVLQSWRDHAKWRVRELLHHLGTYYANCSPSTARPSRTWRSGGRIWRTPTSAARQGHARRDDRLRHREDHAHVR